MWKQIYSPMRCEKWKSFFPSTMDVCVLVLFFLLNFIRHYQILWPMFVSQTFCWTGLFSLPKTSQYLQFAVNIDEIWTFRIRLVSIFAFEVHRPIQDSGFFSSSAKHCVTFSFLPLSTRLWIWVWGSFWMCVDVEGRRNEWRKKQTNKLLRNGNSFI